MSPLILHKVKNGFLVALHKGEQFIDLSESFVAHSAAELIEHIEAHFSRSVAPAVHVPAEATRATLEAARDELAEPVPTAPAAQVQA